MSPKEILRFVSIFLSVLLSQPYVYAQGKVTRIDGIHQQQISYPSNISKPSGFEMKQGYVDLGLSSGTLWANCNIGAGPPTDYGDYFAWAEIKTKSSYSRDNCTTYDIYYADGIRGNVESDTVRAAIRIIGNPKHDAALAIWKGNWSLPSAADFAELNKECSWMYKIINGHKGYVITGPNGNSIFLPSAGYIDGTQKSQVGTGGFYWTGDYWDKYERSTSFNFTNTSHNGVIWSYRDKGKTIRPILKKSPQHINWSREQ